MVKNVQLLTLELRVWFKRFKKCILCWNVPEESSIVPMALCPVGTMPLILRTYALLTPTLHNARSCYLFIYWNVLSIVCEVRIWGCFLKVTHECVGFRVQPSCHHICLTYNMLHNLWNLCNLSYYRINKWFICCCY